MWCRYLIFLLRCLILHFFSCCPAARLHPAGLVRRPGRGDGDLFWGRLSCLLPGALTILTIMTILTLTILICFGGGYPACCQVLCLDHDYLVTIIGTFWLRQSWPASLFWHFDGEATLLDYTRISWLAWSWLSGKKYWDILMRICFGGGLLPSTERYKKRWNWWTTSWYFPHFVPKRRFYANFRPFYVNFLGIFTLTIVITIDDQQSISIKYFWHASKLYWK